MTQSNESRTLATGAITHQWPSPSLKPLLDKPTEREYVGPLVAKEGTRENIKIDWTIRSIIGTWKEHPNTWTRHISALIAKQKCRQVSLIHCN